MLGGILALIAFDQSQFYPLVKDMSIQYKAPAKSDVRAQAELSDDDIARIESEATQNGKSEYVVEAVVTALRATLGSTDINGLLQTAVFVGLALPMPLQDRSSTTAT